jgi:hypothetical protein
MCVLQTTTHNCKRLNLRCSAPCMCLFWGLLFSALGAGYDLMREEVLEWASPIRPAIISSLFSCKFEINSKICSNLKMFKFEICSNLKLFEFETVQIQNCSNLKICSTPKIAQNRNLFHSKFVQINFFVQIRKSIQNSKSIQFKIYSIQNLCKFKIVQIWIFLKLEIVHILKKLNFLKRK